MGSHHPLGRLKHKLWSKERSRVKLVVWLPTTRSWELTRFTCAQVTCDTSLESSWQRLQLWFTLHLNSRFARKVMGTQSRGSFNFSNFEIPTWESRDKMPFRCGPRGEEKVNYKGKGGGFPQVRAVVSLVGPSCPWFILTPKVLQLCTNHLVLVLCRLKWVSEACQFFLVPSQSSSMPLYPSKMLRAKERASTPCSFVVFCLGFTFETLKELGVCQYSQHIT
jgi:hypothetical protein